MAELDLKKHVLFKLCDDALEKDVFQTACTILRIQGMTDGPWDSLEESRATIAHYWELATAERTDPRKKMRLGLGIYCHVTEMDAPYELTSNWLRILEGKGYRYFPFADIQTRPGVPPSVSQKLKRIKDQCDATKRPEIHEYLSMVIDHGVRNSFYHSDYVITPEEYRYTDKFASLRVAKAITRKQVNELVGRGLEYYAQFLSVYDSVKVSFKKVPLEHAQANGEKLVFLVDDTVGLIGFRYERPNADPVIYERTSAGTVCQNIDLSAEGLTFVG